MAWQISKIFLPYVGSITGRENIPPGQCVVVANHESPFDPPLLMAALGRNIRFVAAAHLHRKASPL